VSADLGIAPGAPRRGGGRLLGHAVCWLPALCVLLPLAVVAWRALDPAGEVWAQVVRYRLTDLLGTTALLLAGVVGLSSAVGVACAWCVTAFEFPGRRHFEWLLVLPLGVPGFVAGAVYLDGIEQATPLFLWVREHLGLEAFLFIQRVMPWLGSVGVLVVTLFPYVYLSCRAAFSGQHAVLIEAARCLGCGPGRAFLRVVLPAARPAIAAGAVLVAMETANDYGVVTLFGLNTLTPGVFRAWSEGSLPAAMRLALVLLGLVGVVLWLERAQRGRRGYAGDAGERPLARRVLGRRGVLLAWAVCGAPLALGLLWPAARFLGWALDAGLTFDIGAYAGALWNSVWLAAAACALVVVTAFALTAGRAAWRLAPGDNATRLASLGYAIPSALLAVGVGALVAPLARIDGFGWLALSASASALVFTYWVRFMAVGIQPLAAGQVQLGADLHGAARMLGRSPGQALRAVDLPLLRPAVLAAVLLCFVDVLKELTLALVMRPFGFETLATLAFRLSSEGRIPEAALPALILVLSGALGVAAIQWLLRSSR